MAVAVKKSLIPQTDKKKKAFSKTRKQKHGSYGKRKASVLTKDHPLLKSRTIEEIAQELLSKINTEIKEQKSSSEYTDDIDLKAIEVAGKKASATAMKVMGFTLVEEKGWLVKKHADGTTEKISKI